MAKAMYQSQDDPGDIEDGNSTNVRDTGTKGFLPLFWGGNAEDGLDDQHVGEEDTGDIYS